MLCGGQVEELGGGLYCRPTVVVDVNHDMKLMKEETFGPILPVMPFKDANEGIALANASEFGLSGAVFSATEASALELARRMNCGAVSLNDAGLTALVHQALDLTAASTRF